MPLSHCLEMVFLIHLATPEVLSGKTIKEYMIWRS
jgi:hypothetical protein